MYVCTLCKLVLQLHKVLLTAIDLTLAGHYKACFHPLNTCTTYHHTAQVPAWMCGS